MTTYDAAVVGAGIIGLAHAFHLARRGCKVLVFERSARAQGASIRNFGMLWPIGQPAGGMQRLALRSRELWLDLLSEARLWYEEVGSLHLAYHPDEAMVLQEFLGSPDVPEGVQWWEPERVVSRTEAVRREGLLGALWSPMEICVDPREVVGGLPGYLTEKWGVEFRPGTVVTGYTRPQVFTSAGRVNASHLYVCSGDDLLTLYPEVFQGLGLQRCKLQMLRTVPQAGGWRLGPMLAAGLTLRHYRSFEACPSLPALRQRFARELPEFDRFGIHVMASQNGRNEIVLGDSHEYDEAIEPFDRLEIERLILDYLQGFLAAPSLEIAARWHGIYIKHPVESYLVARPEAGVTVVGAVGGAGMTLSFGLAEKVVNET